MSSILETFLIMFQSNADDVRKGADEARRPVDDLQDRLNSTNRVTGKLGESFLSVARSAAGAIAAAVSIGAIVGGIREAANYADMLDETSEALDISVSELDAWGGALKLSGGSIEEFVGNIKGLSASMAQLDTLGKSRVQPFFKELGINMLDAAGKARPVLDLLPEIAGAFESMTKQETIGFGRKLGLSDGMIMLLQKGRREIESIIARQKELGTVSAEDAAAAAAYNDSVDDTSRVFRVLFSQLAGDLLPALTSVNGAFQILGQWFQDHKGFIYGFMVGLTALVTAFGVRAAWAAIASGALTLPMVLWAAAILAVASLIGLLWDDFQKFSEGAPSLLGSAIEYFGVLGATFMDNWNRLKETVLGIIDDILAAWNKFSNKITSFQAAVPDWVGNLVNKAQISMSGAQSPIGAQTSTSIATTSNQSAGPQVKIGEVNIQTQATDSSGIAKDIGNDLHNQMRQTVSNMDDGVKG